MYMLRTNDYSYADISTSNPAMTAQSVRPTVMVWNSMEKEGQFRKIFAGFIDGKAIPADQVQHARLTDRMRRLELQII